MSYDNKSNFGGLFGNYSSSNPSMNVPVTSSSASSVISPYLNIDPSYLGIGGDSQFILPEGASHTRGRFELAFNQIGGSVFVGGFIGGSTGLYRGFIDTRHLLGPVRRTQILNYITKQGASTAQTLGIVALMYSGIGVILSKVRGADDEMNTVVAATMTGALYKSSSGLRTCAKAGVIGFGLSSAYLIATRLDRLKQMIGFD